jgi:hypothetical protein
MRNMKEIERLVAEQESRGQSVPLFCAERGLNSKSFYLWRQKVRRHRDRFVPVVVTDRVELELEGGIRLKVGKHDLKAVLAALR